jgi:hypothetical protein
MNTAKLKWAVAGMLLLGTMVSIGISQAPELTTPIQDSVKDFEVLSISTVPNTSPPPVTGNPELFTSDSITDLGSIPFTGTAHQNAAIDQQAQLDVTTGYNTMAGMPATVASDLTNPILGDRVEGEVTTLGLGVHSFPSMSARLNGTLQPDAGGINGGYGVSRSGATLASASASAAQAINAGSRNGSDVGEFQVDKGSAFEGNILALANITLDPEATIRKGRRARVLVGAVPLDDNTITNHFPFSIRDYAFNDGSESVNNDQAVPSGSDDIESDSKGQIAPMVNTAVTSVPESGTLLLLGSALAGLIGFRKIVLSR